MVDHTHKMLCVDYLKLQHPQTQGCDRAAQEKVLLNTFEKLVKTRDWWKQSGKCQVRSGTGLGDTRRFVFIEEKSREKGSKGKDFFVL